MEYKLENLKSKKIIIIGVILIILSFFIGRSSVSKNKMQASNFQNGNQQARMKGAGANSFGGMIRGVVGTFSDNSLVVKGQDGSSKIVLLSSSTTISKSMTGLSSDLVKDVNVMIRGKANSDGSVVAESIQIFSDQDFQFQPKR